MTVFVDLSLTVTIPLVCPNILGSQSPGLTYSMTSETINSGFNLLDVE